MHVDFADNALTRLFGELTYLPIHLPKNPTLRRIVIQSLEAEIQSLDDFHDVTWEMPKDGGHVMDTYSAKIAKIQELDYIATKIIQDTKEGATPFQFSTEKDSP